MRIHFRTLDPECGHLLEERISVNLCAAKLRELNFGSRLRLAAVRLRDRNIIEIEMRRTDWRHCLT